jgi:ATP-dependent Clp protease protease subunit
MEDDTSRSPEIWVTKFDEESAQKFRIAVLDAAKGDHTRPVIIHIDSYGGAVDSLAKMIETMDEINNPIVTVCMGKAMSCGAILLAHGDIRFLSRHSRIMVHEVSSGTIGDVYDMHADVKETVRLNEYFMGILARDCGFKNYAELRALIKGQDGRDRYLHGEEAIKFGIVDALGLPKISGRIMYEVGKQRVKAPFANRNKQTIITSKRKSKSKIKKSDTKKS